MSASSLLEPLDMKHLPNFRYVGERFRTPAYDDPAKQKGLRYSVPYFYGTTGYCQRLDKVSPAEDELGCAVGPAQQGTDQPARRRARVPRAWH